LRKEGVGSVTDAREGSEIEGDVDDVGGGVGRFDVGNCGLRFRGCAGSEVDLGGIVGGEVADRFFA